MTNGRGFWVLLMCLGGAAAHADDATLALFAGTEPIPITLEGPFAQLQRDDDAEPAYRPATLTWKDAAGTDVRIPLEVRPRGKSRRDELACEFPPLRLNFPKDGPAGTPFSTLNKVKLVTHCGPLRQRARAVRTTRRTRDAAVSGVQSNLGDEFPCAAARRHVRRYGSRQQALRAARISDRARECAGETLRRQSRGGREHHAGRPRTGAGESRSRSSNS